MNLPGLFSNLIVTVLFLSTSNLFAANTIGKLSGDTASVTSSMKQTLTASISKAEAAVVGIFEEIPGVTSAKLLGVADSKQVTTKDSTTTTIKKLVHVKYADSRVFPESVFSVTETKTVCSTDSAAKKINDLKKATTSNMFLTRMARVLDDSDSSSSCTSSYSAVISGPIYSYISADGEFHPVNAADLNESYEVTLNLSEGTAGTTTMSFNFSFKNRNYQNYLRALTARNYLSATPTDKEIQSAFLLWGKQALDRIKNS